ncbi:MAG: MFS transporter [Acidimicrobiia bacterium]
MEQIARPLSLLLRKGPFARLWWAGVVSSFGDWVALFATIALADQLGGVTGILVPLSARMLPGLFGAVSGVLADRFNRKFTMITADLARAVLVLSLVFVDNLAMLFLVSFLMETLTLFWQPARDASVPNLVPPGRLVAANSITLVATYGSLPVSSAFFSFLVTVGDWVPDLAGFGSGFGPAFTFDAFTFLLSAFLVARIEIPKPEVAEHRKAKGASDWRAPLRDLLDGVRFVISDSGVRNVIVGMATALFGAGIFFILGQPFSRDVLGGGNTGFGVLITSLGSGVGGGMLVLATLGSKIGRRDLTFAISLILTGAAITMATTMSSVFGAAGWLFIAGIGAGSSYVMGYTHLHEQVDDEMRGRTFAALHTLARTSLLISIALGGVAAAALNDILPAPFDNGIRNALAIGGAIVLSAGLVTLWNLRGTLSGPEFSEETYRTLKDASDAFTAVRGQRRSPEDPK